MFWKKESRMKLIEMLINNTDMLIYCIGYPVRIELFIIVFNILIGIYLIKDHC